MKGKQDLDFTTDEEKEAVKEIFEGALSGESCLIGRSRLGCDELQNDRWHCRETDSRWAAQHLHLGPLEVQIRPLTAPDLHHCC